MHVTNIKLLIYLFICRSQVHNLHLDGHPVTVYKTQRGNNIRITDPSDILLLSSENTFIVQEALMHLILPGPNADTPSDYSSDLLQGYLKHLLTEFTPDSLVIQTERLDCDFSHVMSPELLLWAIDKGYSVDTIGNKIVCKR